MSTHERDVRVRLEPERPVGYEPPRIERVLRPQELEREGLYAGAAAPSPTVK